MEVPACEDPRLSRLTAVCDGLPETARQMQGRHADFRVRGRLFASFLDDHHSDGIVALQFKLPGGENEMLLAAEPGRFYRPAYMGARGWLALRLDQGPVDWEVVTELVTDSYLRAAPKRLVALVEQRLADACPAHVPHSCQVSTSIQALTRPRSRTE